MAKRPDPALLARGKPSNSQTPAKEPAGNPANKSHFIPPSAQQSPVQHGTSPKAEDITYVSDIFESSTIDVVIGIDALDSFSYALVEGNSNLSKPSLDADPTDSGASIVAIVDEVHDVPIILSLKAEEALSPTVIDGNSSVSDSLNSLSESLTASINEDTVTKISSQDIVLDLRLSDDDSNTLYSGNSSLSQSSITSSDNTTETYIHEDQSGVKAVHMVVALSINDSSSGQKVLSSSNISLVDSSLNQFVWAKLFNESSNVLQSNSVFGLKLDDSSSYDRVHSSSSLVDLSVDSLDESLSALITSNASSQKGPIDSVIGLRLAEVVTTSSELSSSSVSQIKLPSMDNVDGAIIENAQGFEYYDVVAGMKAGESVSSDLIFASSLLSVDEITVSGTRNSAYIYENINPIVCVADSVLDLSISDYNLETEVHEIKQGSTFVYWPESSLSGAEVSALSNGHDSVILLKSRPYPYILQDIFVSTLRGRVDFMISAKGYVGAGQKAYDVWDDKLTHIEIVYLPHNIESPPLIIAFRKDVYNIGRSIEASSSSLSRHGISIPSQYSSVDAEILEGKGMVRHANSVVGLRANEITYTSPMNLSSISSSIVGATISQSDIETSIHESNEPASWVNVVVVGLNVVDSNSSQVEAGHSNISQLGAHLYEENMSSVYEEGSINALESDTILGLALTDNSPASSLVLGQSSLSKPDLPVSESLAADISVSSILHRKLTVTDNVLSSSVSENLIDNSILFGQSHKSFVSGIVSESNAATISEGTINELQANLVLSLDVSSTVPRSESQQYYTMPENLNFQISEGSTNISMTGGHFHLVGELPLLDNFIAEDQTMFYVPNPPVDTTPPPVFKPTPAIPPSEEAWLNDPTPTPIYTITSRYANLNLSVKYLSDIYFFEFGHNIRYPDAVGDSDFARVIAKQVVDLLISGRSHRNAFVPAYGRIFDTLGASDGQNLSVSNADNKSKGTMRLLLNTPALTKNYYSRYPAHGIGPFIGDRLIPFPEIAHWKGGRAYLNNGTHLLGVVYGSARSHPLERNSLGGWGLGYTGQLIMSGSGVSGGSDEVDTNINRMDLSNDTSFFFDCVLRGDAIGPFDQLKGRPDWYILKDGNDTTLSMGYIHWKGSNGSYNATVKIDTDIYPERWILGSTGGTSSMKAVWGEGSFSVTGGSMDRFIWNLSMSG